MKQPASGFIRVSASSIDMLCCLVPILLALMFGILDASALHTPAGWFRSEWLLKLWLDSPGKLTAPLLWYVILLFVWQASWQLATFRTPGAMFMGIELVDEVGLEPTRPRIAARVALSLLVPLTLGLSYLWIWPSRQKRAWHDIFSGTWLVRQD